MNITKHIPNTITCLSLVSGCIAIVVALGGNLLWATIWLLIAAVLDFLDGFAARMLHAYSAIGKDLDSLSDMVSFGVAPGMMLFALLSATVNYLPGIPFSEYLPYLAFVIPAFSGLRLAKFNNDPRQSESFIGLPVPAHAMLWSCAAYSFQPMIPHFPGIVVCMVVAGSIITSLLLVSEVPMFSLKAKSFGWKGNEKRYLLLLFGLVSMIVCGLLGITFTIILYILLSLGSLFKK